MTDILRTMNHSLNELKSKRPNDVALIEAIQTEINKKTQIISPSVRKSLLQFPLQFTQRVRTSSRDWTTQLHYWADYQLEDLLRLDPIYLTTGDSNDDSVLKRLVMAALGLTQTQIVNYELLEKIFQKDMKYSALTVAGDPDSAEGGNAWFERDLEGKTVIEFLYDFANGEGEFQGRAPDERILKMFDTYADSALALPEDMDLPDPDFDEEDKEDIENINASPETTDEPTAAPTGEEGHETSPEDQQDLKEIASPNNGEAKEEGGNSDKLSKVLNVLMKLSECV